MATFNALTSDEVRNLGEEVAFELQDTYGITATMEYPVFVAIQVIPELSIWTGGIGFDYATAYTSTDTGIATLPNGNQVVDGEAIESGLLNDETDDVDAARIAAAWAAKTLELRSRV